MVAYLLVIMTETCGHLIGRVTPNDLIRNGASRGERLTVLLIGKSIGRSSSNIS